MGKWKASGPRPNLPQVPDAQLFGTMDTQSMGNRHGQLHQKPDEQIVRSQARVAF
jgi:hypothetical protein